MGFKFLPKRSVTEQDNQVDEMNGATRRKHSLLSKTPIHNGREEKRHVIHFNLKITLEWGWKQRIPQWTWTHIHPGRHHSSFCPLRQKAKYWFFFTSFFTALLNAFENYCSICIWEYFLFFSDHLFLLLKRTKKKEIFHSPQSQCSKVVRECVNRNISCNLTFQPIEERINRVKYATDFYYCSPSIWNATWEVNESSKFSRKFESLRMAEWFPNFPDCSTFNC